MKISVRGTGGYIGLVTGVYLAENENGHNELVLILMRTK